jgi:hypothetical protein
MSRACSFRAVCLTASAVYGVPVEPPLLVAFGITLVLTFSMRMRPIGTFST